MERRGFLAALPAAWVAWRQRGGLPETTTPTVHAVVYTIPSPWVHVTATANTSATLTVQYVTGLSSSPSVTVTRVVD